MRLSNLLGAGALVVALVLPTYGWGADGDEIASVDATTANSNTRPNSRKFYICDSDVDPATCDTLLIRRAGQSYVFAVDEDTTCTAYNIDIQTQSTVNGDFHVLNTFVLPGGDSMAVWNTELPARFNAVINSETACEDIDVTVEVFYRRND